MSYQIRPLGFNQVAVLYNGKHVKKFGGANAALDAREFIKTQTTQSLPKARPAGLGARQVVDEMFNINSNISRFDESMLEGFEESEINDMIEKYVGFEKLASELKGKGAKDPEAVAAFIGRKKYGKKKFQKMAEATAPELLKKQMPLVNQSKDTVKSYGYKEGSDDYKKALDTEIAFRRKFGNTTEEQVGESGAVQINEQRHPLSGHEYHKKSDAELSYIIKDASAAAKAMSGHNPFAESKYLDQANDASTVRHWRQTNGMPAWYKKQYGHGEKTNESLDEAVHMGKWMQTHDELEDNNAHTDNMVRVAKLVGDENDQKEMAGIKKRHEQLGGLSYEDSQKRSALNKKLWPKVVQKYNDWESKNKGKGVQEETNLGNEGEFKKSKETFKAAKKQVKQGNPEGSLEVKEATNYEVTIAHTRNGTERKVNMKTSRSPKVDAAQLLRPLEWVKNIEKTTGNEGEFKKSKETFKAAKKQEKLGNPAGSLEVTESVVDHNHPDYRYKKGQQVHIRKEWQDEGDAEGEWHVAEDQDPRGGRVVIKSSLTKDMKIQPTHVVTPDMIEPHKSEEKSVTEARGIAEGDWHVMNDDTGEIHSTHSSYRKATNAMNKLNNEHRLSSEWSDRVAEYRPKSNPSSWSVPHKFSIRASSDIKESFKASIFDGETISESVDIELTNEDVSYSGILRAMMETFGISAISDIETREDRMAFIDAVESFSSNEDYSCVLENYLRNDVEERINKHRELGNKVSGATYSTKSGKPYAEFMVTTPEGVKKRYVFHGNVTRHEVVSVE